MTSVTNFRADVAAVVLYFAFVFCLHTLARAMQFLAQSNFREAAFFLGLAFACGCAFVACKRVLSAATGKS